MAITDIEMLGLLQRMGTRNLIGPPARGQAEEWAGDINDALPNVTQQQILTAIRRIAQTRTTTTRGIFLSPGDLIEAVQGITAEEKRERRERLEQARRMHGDFTIHPAVTQPDEYLLFKQTATATFCQGATVQQAQTAAWAAIGRTPPPPEITSSHPTDNLPIGTQL